MKVAGSDWCKAMLFKVNSAIKIIFALKKSLLKQEVSQKRMLFLSLNHFFSQNSDARSLTYLRILRTTVKTSPKLTQVNKS